MPIITFNNASTKSHLLTKQELAPLLGLTPRGIDGLVAARKIPALRLGHKTLRFDLKRVMEALARFEQKEVA